MGYDVPQKLKYKEIIAFGLTLKQLIITVITTIIIGTILLPDLKNPIKITLSAIIFLIGFGVTFLEVEKHFMNLYKFSRFKKANSKDETLKQYLSIKNLNGNTLKLNNNTLLGLLEVEPISINLLSDLQKESITQQFQKFLNSLDFPIQIITTTNTQEFFQKNFFVIIPKKSDLTTQVSLVRKKLKECGLNTKILKDYKIIQVFNNFFKNKTAEVSIKELRENYAHHILAPCEIKNNKDFLEQENNYSRVISVVGYPRSVNFGFLDKIIKMQEKVDLSIHLEPFSIEKLTIKLNSELQKQEADLYSVKNKGGSNPILEIKHSDTKKVLENLQKGEEKLFLVSLYFHCKANNLKELDLLTEKIKNELNSLLMIPKIPLFTQAQALKSCLPLCQNILKEQRNITTKPLSAFFPFTTRFNTQDKEGVEFGKNEIGQPIKKNIFKLSNHNGAILASSGGGKSYLTKLLVQRYTKIPDQKVFVIDPEGEYTNLIEKLGGQVITIGINSKNNINIFDSFGQDLKIKKLKIHEIFYLLFPDLGEVQRSYLDKAIQYVYEKHANDGKTPFIGELYHYLTQKESEAKDPIDKKVLSGVNNRLSMFVTGAFDFMNQQTNIKLEKSPVCFYLKDIPSMIQPALMYLIMDYLYVQMRNTPCNKIVFVDEAWNLLQKTKEDTYLFKLIKTCRKYKMGIFLITQEADDLVNDKTGKALLANSSTTILLRQKNKVINKLSEIFDLNHEEKINLTNANIGSGIAIFDKERHALKIVSNKEEHDLIEEKKTQEFEEENPYPDLDLNKPYHKYSDLTNDKITFLIKKDYLITDCTPIGHIRSFKFLVKKNARQSPHHYFLVHNILEEIKKHTNKVFAFETVRPDIIFEHNNKKYAIEIETSKFLEHHKKRIFDKVKQNNEEFGKNWFFLITKAQNFYFYSKQAPTYKIFELQTVLRQIFENTSPPHITVMGLRNETPKNPDFEYLKPIAMQKIEAPDTSSTFSCKNYEGENNVC
ncbi:ATP-binding protein [Candidatus Woesearchaeota archaeon]|nr:ATP-binding protein [Candidatus Woesearchaeota archaeon]